ncbi:MAG TPA: heavy metal translocating P-type ATPase metal-binding domain-containing protein, partial [Bacteroidia bacterium]|nr:heavy metal translocating P-type ATPase metal-binding domain-containing protein [Bacteroidia bacterium]
MEVQGSKVAPEKELLNCFHCGDTCREDTIHAHEKVFCCEGCKLVFEILDENNLCNYYTLNATPGSTETKKLHSTRYDFLEDEKVKQKLISFTDGTITNITLFIPQIHCSSCIWLLEHLYKLDTGVKRSTVNFLKREVNLVFKEDETSLRKIAELLDRIGYTPHISLENLDKKNQDSSNKTVYYKLGVAFFCFGNIMLLSFPEYFGLEELVDSEFRKLFGFLNILLSLPVLLYADTDFFKSAVAGLRQGRLNMDFPISLGIVVMYGRSLFEILSGTGSGYMDTFAGLIFFMLSGRLFQNKTYERLSFERDYKSYFPVAITVIENGKEMSKAVSEVKRGDRIIIRNEELIPADAIIIKGDANIDYSFVTGENIPIPKKSGDRIYAGGKQMGPTIELEVINEVSQSKLTQLWNESNFGHEESAKNVNSIVDRVSKVFSIVVILIAMGAGGWYVFNNELPKALNSFTAVLIITCPCALALSYPFTLGNSIRILGNKKFYLKNTRVIEKLSHVNTIVFDKTGTLTKAGEAVIEYFGKGFNDQEKIYIHSVTSNSTHPLSRLLTKHLDQSSRIKISSFSEVAGKGIEGIAEGNRIRIGSSGFVKGPLETAINDASKTSVHVSINDGYYGYFTVSSIYREGLIDTVGQLQTNHELHLLSGDNNSERQNLTRYFGHSDNMHFNQSPSDKLTFIKKLQQGQKNVMMLGDG